MLNRLKKLIERYIFQLTYALLNHLSLIFKKEIPAQF